MVTPSTHYFTLAEANLALEVVRPLVAQILEYRQAIKEEQPEAWPMVSKAAGNGGGLPASHLAFDFDRLDQAVRQVQATGAILKDINTGLVDFLSIREEREIYLCWRYGEDQITFWHEIDAGFSGRNPL